VARRPSLGRRAALEDAHRTIQQLLLPVVDVVRVHPKCTANSAMVRSPLIAATATFALNAALCFFRVRFMFYSRAIRAF
jgi:hypothetical protein